MHFVFLCFYKNEINITNNKKKDWNQCFLCRYEKSSNYCKF